jgi:hypothetical protein
LYAKTTFLAMNRSPLLSFFVSIGLCVQLACTRDTLNLPEPAQTIEGDYEALNNQMTFPVQGKTLRLTVQRVATDSVSVLVRAVDNGQYGDSLSFKRAHVSQARQFNCIAYRVDMGSQQRIDQLTMTCDEVNVFKYLYKPANQQAFSIVKFRKI